MRAQTIADVLEFQLKKLSESHRGVSYPSDENHLERIRAAINKHNSRINCLIENEEFSANDVNQMKVNMPDAFKQRPRMYESIANFYWGDGTLSKQTKFGIEVLG